MKQLFIIALVSLFIVKVQAADSLTDVLAKTTVSADIDVQVRMLPVLKRGRALISADCSEANIVQTNQAYVEFSQAESWRRVMIAEAKRMAIDVPKVEEEALQLLRIVSLRSYGPYNDILTNARERREKVNPRRRSFYITDYFDIDELRAKNAKSERFCNQLDQLISTMEQI
jgi:hypothetical protein